MKKLYVLLACLLVLTAGIYITFRSSSKASNKSPTFEYYYNNDNNISEDEIGMNYNNTNINTTTDTDTKIDTNPSSTLVFVNKEYSLPSDYIPEDLIVPDILFQENAFHEKKLLREEAAKALEDLVTDAKDQGLTIYGVSGYRSYKRQKEIYESNLRTKGATYTNRYSAVPGYSEHQSGLSMDVSTPSINFKLESAFAGTPEGKWLKDHAHEYGFIIRYPEGKQDITGYSYEPWHIRYVGKDTAKDIYDKGITFEEYLGYTPPEGLFESISSNYVVDIESDPVNTPKPTKSPTPTPEESESPEPSEEPSESPSPSPKPTKTPTPTKTPKPTVTPTETPVPTTTPTPTPEVTPTPIPTETPLPTEPPVDENVGMNP